MALPGLESRQQKVFRDGFGFVTLLNGFIGGATTAIPSDKFHHFGTVSHPDGSVEKDLIEPGGRSVIHEVTTKKLDGTELTTRRQIIHDEFGRVVREIESGHEDIVTSYEVSSTSDLPGWHIIQKRGPEILSDTNVDFAGRIRAQRKYITKVGGNSKVTESVTNYLYNNDDGRLVTIVPPVDAPIQIVSDLFGRIIGSSQGQATQSSRLNCLGWILSSVDVNGSSVSRRYDLVGNVTYVTNPAGGLQMMEYDGEGHVLAVKNGNGVRAFNVYDEAGIKTASIDEFGRRTECKIEANTISWNDPALPAVSVKASFDASLAIKEISKLGTGLQARTVIAMGSAGDGTIQQAGRGVKSFDVDALGRPSVSTSPMTLDGSEVGIKSQVIYASGTDVPESSICDDGLQTTIQRDPVTGEVNALLSTAHGPELKPIMTVLERDLEGRLLAILDADGNITRYGYDPIGRQSMIQLPGYSPSVTTYIGGGNRADTVVRGDDVWKYVYHVLGGVTATYLNGVEKSASDYDQYGRLLMARSCGATTTYRYDQTTGVLSEITGPSGTTSYKRDSRGLVTYENLPGGRSVHYLYDANERLSGRVYNDNTSHGYSYDINGDLHGVRDRVGKWLTVTSRDAQGQIAGVATDSGDTLAFSHSKRSQGGFIHHCREVTDKVVSTMDVANDPGGFPVQTSLPGQEVMVSTASNSGRTTSRGDLTYSYPDANTIIISNKGGHNTTLTYQDGKLTRVLNSNGHARDLNYTAGKLSQVKDQVGGVTWTTTYEWTTDGKLKNSLTPFGTESYVYQDQRLIGWTRADGSVAIRSFDEGGHPVVSELVRGDARRQQKINCAQKPSPMTVICGKWESTGDKWVGLGEDGASAMASLSVGSAPLITASATVAVPKPFTGWMTAGFAVNMVMDSQGQPTKWHEWRIKSLVTRGRVSIRGVFVLVDKGQEAEIAQTEDVNIGDLSTVRLELRRIAGGLVAVIVDNSGQAKSSPLTVNQVTLGGGLGVVGLSDGGTPRIEVVSLEWVSAVDYQTRQIEFNSLDQPVTIHEKSPTTDRVGIINYDKLGNQLGISWNDGSSVSNRYDSWNRLISQGKDGHQVAVTYVPGGVERLSCGGTKFIRDTAGMLGYESDGKLKRLGIYGRSAYFEVDANNNLETHVLDGEGTVRGKVGVQNGSSPMFLSRMFTEPTGEVYRTLFASVLNITGVEVIESSQVNTLPHGYQWLDGKSVSGIGWRGFWHDAESETYQLGHRVYSPATNGFLQRDPAMAGDDWYAYASGDPVNRWDPSGLWDINYTQGTAVMEPGDTWESLQDRLGLKLPPADFLTGIANANPGLVGIDVGDSVKLNPDWTAGMAKRYGQMRSDFIGAMNTIGFIRGDFEGDVTDSGLKAMIDAGVSSYQEMRGRNDPIAAGWNKATAWSKLNTRLGNAGVFITKEFLEERAYWAERSPGVQLPPRVQGGLRVIGGVPVFLAGAATSEIGIGIPAAVWSGDQVGTGVKELWTNEHQDSMGSKLIKSLAGDGMVGQGASLVYDVAPAFLSPSGAAKWHRTMQAKYTWGAPPGGHWTQGVSHTMRKELGLVGTPAQLHHWLIPQRWTFVPNYIKNLRWNIVVAADRAAHARIDTAFSVRGVDPYPLMIRPWMAMPNWARAASVGVGTGGGWLLDDLLNAP